MAKIRLSLAAALCVLLAAFPAMAEPMKIGAILSSSGALGVFGANTRHAVDLAIAQINGAGGVLGAPVALSAADDRSDPQAAVEAARKLAGTDKVNAFVGPMGSAAFQAVATNVAVPAGLPMVSGSATASALDGLDTKGLAVRTVPSDALQGAALAQVARDKGYRAVGVLYANGDYGKGLADAFAKSFGKLGGKVTAAVAFDAKQPGSHGEIKAAATGRPEALLVVAYPEDGANLVKQALDAGAFNKFLLSDALKDGSVIDNVGGQFLDGVSGAVAVAPADSEGQAAFAKAFADKFGELPSTPYLDRTYDAVMLLALAAEQAKSTNGAKIAAAVREVTAEGGEKIGPLDFAKAKQLLGQGKRITYEGAAGPYAFDAQGKPAGTFAHWQIQDGKFETVRLFVPKN